MNEKAMFQIGYGLYVLTAQEDGVDNGCITNSVMQVTSKPNRIAITVNKQNKTHDMIFRTAKAAVSVLTEAAPFSIYQHFGFQSGKNVDKFADFTDVARAENGLYYVTKYTNAYMAGTVYHAIDLGTHTMFLLNVEECEILSDVPSVTYNYYQKHVKPRPAATETRDQKGYRCTVCGYIYEGEVLPEDFVCPICKHGAADFEPI
ncbi:MAG: flavin reductase [Lachnospiraceae bacterium]|nr:flavin reductase [Lachnospiraceae bacterium]